MSQMALENQLQDSKVSLEVAAKICKERDKIGGVSFADVCRKTRNLVPVRAEPQVRLRAMPSAAEIIQNFATGLSLAKIREMVNFA